MVAARLCIQRITAFALAFAFFVNYLLLFYNEEENSLKISSLEVAAHDNAEVTNGRSPLKYTEEAIHKNQDSSNHGGNSIEDMWSAKAFMEKNESTMLTFPMEKWPSYSSSNRGSCPFNISFYVFQDLPTTVSTEVEDFVKDELEDGKQLRTEVAIEWSLVQLFRTSACRTDNASEADLTIVPYMHSADCDHLFDPQAMLAGCGQVKNQRVMQIRHHEGLKDVPLERQIYISMGHEQATNSFLRFNNVFHNFEGSLKAKITTGDRQHNGVFAMPLVPMTPRYQPSIISGYDEAWWTRPRKYAFAAIYGGLNDNHRPYHKQPRCFRLFFFNHLKENYPDESNFAGTGLPYLAHMGDTKDILAMSKQESKYQYNDSILCPILAGDSPFLTRFFDVILKGCIPVVLEWELFQQTQFGGRGVGEKKLSWHIPDRVRMCLPTDVFKPKHYKVSNIVETYPFIDSLSTYNNTNDPKSYEWSIDYRSFVVVAKGRVGADEEYQSDMRPIFEAMKSALNDPSDIRRRQLNMKKYATRLTLGVGLDAHKYDDSFAGMLKLLELYKEGLKNV